MTSLEKILHYLDTTSRVSCPQITQAQAAEIAAILRRHVAEFDKVESVACGISFDAIRHITDIKAERTELKKRLEKLKQPSGRDPAKYSDCPGCDLCEFTRDISPGDIACGFAFDAGIQMVHLEDGLDCGRFNQAPRCDWWSEPCRAHSGGYWQRFAQEACGFAWDAGREMADTETRLAKARDNAKYWMAKAINRRRIDREEATGDIDPGIYEGTGKGFNK